MQFFRNAPPWVFPLYDIGFVLIFASHTSTSFHYHNQHSVPTTVSGGVATGSPVSPVVSDNIHGARDFLTKPYLMEITILPDLLRLWKRFLDDILTVIKQDKGSPLVNHLNEQLIQTLNLQWRKKKAHRLLFPFLDVHFTRPTNGSGELHRQVLIPETNTLWIGTYSLIPAEFC